MVGVGMSNEKLRCNSGHESIKPIVFLVDQEAFPIIAPKCETKKRPDPDHFLHRRISRREKDCSSPDISARGRYLG
jgi:hypothetical protein